MARKATQTPVFFDIGKHDFNGLTPQAVHRLRFGRLHPGPVGLDQLFMFAPLHTASAFLTRRTLLAQGTSLAGLRRAPILPLDHFTPATAPPRVATDPLEQMAGWTFVSIEVAVPLKPILAKRRARFGLPPIVGFPWPLEPHALRRTLGQVHARHARTIDQQVFEVSARQPLAAPQQGRQRRRVTGLGEHSVAQD